MRWFRSPKPVADPSEPQAPTAPPIPPIPTTAAEAGLSPRQAAILDLGWEIMRANGMPHIFLWLAEDGWISGHEILAIPYDGQVAVRIKPWETLTLPPQTTLN